MKALQELVPSSNKTARAAMLNEIVDYVKFLRLQVKVLNVFSFLITITTFQFAIGTTLVLFIWIFNLHKRPKITSAQGLNAKDVCIKALVAGICFHAYQQEETKEYVARSMWYPFYHHFVHEK